ncbi:OmpA family protein [Amycolatopsis suaedae]|uniref:OmpA family protein n=1 Tax=Amycolatopsis suaedae TaxID=2510978 RepID=A0A4Q7J2Q8_9PSEU|nr:OmpA family protein [Amycolatopsis suaedae]RZQ61751.1 OmpA family protein [Amycolatopsis suaedae]
MAVSRRGVWVLVPVALVVTGALAGAAGWWQGGRIESDLADRSRAALSSAGVQGASVSFEGRDGRITGVPADLAEKASSAVRAVEGVRVVQVDTAAVAAGTPASAGTDDPKAALQAEIDRLLAADPIAFVPDTAEPTAEGRRTAAKVAELVIAAPEGTAVEVGGHVARTPGDEETARRLSQERADAVARLLVEGGVDRERVTAVGFGDTRPKPGAGDDRRVEVTVR